MSNEHNSIKGISEEVQELLYQIHSLADALKLAEIGIGHTKYRNGFSNTSEAIADIIMSHAQKAVYLLDGVRDAAIEGGGNE